MSPIRDYVRTVRAARTLLRLRRPAGRANPYPFFERARRKGPLIFIPKHNWIVTRYAEASAILRDSRFSSDQSTRSLRPGWDEYWREFTKKYPERPVRLTNTMIFKDGGDHQRLRGLVSKAFTPRVIEGLRDRVQALANELLEGVEARGHMDLIADYAYPLPVTIICELLGIPVEDREDFRQWTAQAARSLDPARSKKADEMIRAGRDAAEAFGSYFTSLVESRRSRPQDDLVTGLINAQEGDDRLATDELLSTFVLLLVAGHVTTTNLIGNGVLSLLRNPDELAKLRADLGPESMRLAVEELLRYEPPVAGVVRIATDDIPFAGTVIPKGHDVIVLISSANRDPAQFPDPDRLDIRRSDNRHLTFSGGPHFCLGAPLARLEGQIAIETLLRRFASIELETDEPEWRETFTMRALKQLPLSLSAS